MLNRNGAQSSYVQQCMRGAHCGHRVALLCAALHCTGLLCSTLHCTALHRSAQVCTALHCTGLTCGERGRHLLQLVAAPAQQAHLVAQRVQAHSEGATNAAGRSRHHTDFTFGHDSILSGCARCKDQIVPLGLGALGGGVELVSWLLHGCMAWGVGVLEGTAPHNQPIERS